MSSQSRSSSSKYKDASDTLHTAGPSSAPISRTQSRSRNSAKEARRIRGEIACAECRRLKIKCDRQVPCSTCVSRGCAVLCPNDVLPPGDNSRHLNSAMDHLKRKMTKMEERIRALEDALAIAQAQESDTPHVLLSTPWKPDDEDVTLQEPQDFEVPNLENLADALGTLHIDEKEKTMQFFGPTGGTESILLDDHRKLEEATAPSAKENITSADLRALGIPEEADLFYFAFPFTPIGAPRSPARVALDAALPPYARAMTLSRTLLENLSWMFQIVTLRYLTNELIPGIYGYPVTGRKSGYGAHDLALLLIVMAVGALVDMTQAPYNAEALRYYVMARAAAGLESMMEKNSLNTVRFLHLLSIYNGLCGKESSLPNTYALLNIAGIMAQRIGLHIDPSHWNMDEKTSYDRRAYFWNLLQGDSWQSLGTGRPPSLANSSDRCRFPSEEEEARFQQGEVPLGFGVWGHRHTKECLIPLLRFVNAAKPPSYQRVLELDKQFRSAALPLMDDAESTSISASMRWWVRAHYIDLILMFLHRGFFAQALATHPENPLQSPYAHSFVTAYHCACHFIRMTRFQFGKQPQLMTRVWQIWTFTLSGALILGAVALQPKQVIIDPPPSQVFEEACTLFEDAGKINSRAAKALPVLLKMREKVRRMQPSGSVSGHTSPGVKEDPSVNEDSEQIAIFGGKTRLVASTGGTSPPPHAAPVHQVHLSEVPQAASQNIPSPDQQWHYLQTNLSPYLDPSVPSDPGHRNFDIFDNGQGQEAWNAPQGYPDTYQYSGANAAENSDFILNDSWTAFLEGHGALPKPT
ncbi:unnamed protein product [Somion occarium]|uniref:Zn(2)-C6 fungal-type domain-containing protein n=1 Tax=Somion occarium TaxID=3059160 RepID=A0ABP1DPD6_9APHY